MASPKGSLTIVGTGVKFISHITLEVLEAIKNAENLYSNVANVVTKKWIQEINSSATPLPGQFTAHP